MTVATLVVEQANYRHAFVEAAGPFPHDCHFCGEEVDGHTDPLDAGAAIVHHVDEDRSNSAPENLVPAHHGCHSAYHMTGKKLSAEIRAKMSASQRARITPEIRAASEAALARARVAAQSPAARAKRIAALRGKQKSPEAVAKTVAARRANGSYRGSPKGSRWSPEARARASAERKGRRYPRLSCVACRQEMSSHLVKRHVCRGGTT